MIEIRQKLNTFILSLFLIFVTFLSSCDMYNVPVKDFFENYVDGMGVEKVTLPEGIKGSDGLLCLATDSEQTFTIQLRNPQKKAFGLKYEFEGADVAALAGDTALTYNPSADRYSAKITFSQDFLHNLDKANCDSKRLSGKIYLTDEAASQIYDTFNVSARANSVPPVALGAMLQADQGVAKGSCILCFYIPVLSNTVHEKDLHKIIINGRTYYFSNEIISGGLAEIYADKDFTELSPDFYESAPTTYPLGPDSTIYPVFPGIAGKPAEAYAAVYYKTNIALSDGNISIKITFEDDYGLSNSVTATNQVAVLDIPAIKGADGNTLSSDSVIEVDPDTRLYPIAITHSGLAYYNSGDYVDCSPVPLSYSVRETNGKPVFDGGFSEITGTDSSTSAINIDLPPGTYEIKATAAKEGYIDSSEAVVSNLVVTSISIFYVSSSGSDDASGSKTKPLATVTKALSKLKDTLADDSTLTDGKIYLLSDIEITDEINLTTYKFADLDPVRNITIFGCDEAGNTAVRTINANSKCRVMQIGCTNGNITLENLIFKGGRTSDSQGGGGLFVSSSDASGKTLEIKNCKFVDNTTAYTGAAILINSDYTVNITDCEISDNTLNGASGSAGIEATQMGTGTYITIKDTKIVDNTVISPNSTLSAFGSALNGSAAVKLAGGVTISGNLITGVAGSIDSSNFGTVYNSKGLKLSGVNIIKDNSLKFTDSTVANRNVVLPYTSGSSVSQKLNVLGDITGSTIYVSIPASSISDAVIFTNGYSAYNSELPGLVFISDSVYAIDLDSSRSEAAFVLSIGKFTEPVIKDSAGNPLTSDSTYPADSDTRLYTISITHSGKARYNSGDDDVDCSPVPLTYSVRETNGKPVFDGNLSEITGTGSSTSAINIELPPGTFEITATAAKEGYISSAVTTVSNVSVSCPAIFYVSSSGSDDAGGSKSKPFATVNMALSKLKDTLADDSTLTDGKIYLLSDIEITEQINLTDYKFADLAPVRNITIAGYDEVRTINANSKCRVMQIGWTNGNITLENLIFKGGTSSDSQGGGGLFVSSSDTSGKTLEIKNCKFVDNTTAYTGAAILINSDYTVDITDCEISGNTLNGASGSAGIEATQMGTGTYITIKDTKIVDNTVISPDTTLSAFGSALNGTAAVKLAGGVTITGNSITGVSGAVDSSNYGAVNNSLGLKLSGTNIIKDNTLKFTDNTVASRNVVLPYNTGSKTVSQKLAVMSDISGSTIYVSIPVDSISSDAVFTSGYGYSSKNPALPGTVFVSDCAYAIGLDSAGSEAAFVLSGGSFTNPFGITMTFALNASVIPAGVASDLTVTPTVMQNGSDITASVLSDISWKLSLMSGSVTIEESVTNTLSVSAADALPDTYTLYIAATLNGIAYDDSAAIVCKDALEGMISVSGANISGAISDSGVFVTGRNLTIPALYVGQHELTQKEYLEYCYYAHSGKQPAASYTGDNYPACFVSWYDAIVYCNLRSIAEGLTPAYKLEGETDPRLWDGIVAGSDSNAGKYCGPLANTESWNNITFDTSANGWRMPVEAEWEYLARGGNLDSDTQTIYAGSNTWEEVAWTAGNASEPHQVKQKAANSLGLYDMSGNVFEYVWDWYGGDITSSVGITGYDSPKKTSDNDYRRIVRGGGYTYSSDYAKVSDRRVYNTPEMRWGNCGVRIVRNVN